MGFILGTLLLPSHTSQHPCHSQQPAVTLSSAPSAQSLSPSQSQRSGTHTWVPGQEKEEGPHVLPSVGGTGSHGGGESGAVTAAWGGACPSQCACPHHSELPHRSCPRSHRCHHTATAWRCSDGCGTRTVPRSRTCLGGWKAMVRREGGGQQMAQPKQREAPEEAWKDSLPSLIQ